MNTKILLFLFFILANKTILSQKINYIEYKQECNFAYKAALDQKKYQASINQLQNIKKKYVKLFREEYILMAYCYKQLNNNVKSAESLYTGWSTDAFDINSINQIEELDSETITKGFTKKQLSHVHQGYKNSQYLHTKLCDSITKTFQIMDKLDHHVREKLEHNPKDSLKIKKEIELVDSIHLIIFKNIIKEYGYPGEKLIPNNTGYAFLILTHSANYTSFFEKMKPVLYNEVINGRMPPSHYVFWLDRYNEAHNLPLEYGILHTESQLNFNEEEKSQIQQKRLELGLIKHFPIPSLQINSK